MKNKFDFQPKLVSALKNYSKEIYDRPDGRYYCWDRSITTRYRFRYRFGSKPERVDHRYSRWIFRIVVRRMQRTNRWTDRCVYRNRIRHYPKFRIEGLAIATVVAGIILVIMGALKLGTVIKFIPYPIVVGFTSGIALTIFTTQMKDLLG